MMKNVILLAIFLLISNIIWSQVSKTATTITPPPGNVERWNVDYTIKNVSVPDNSLLIQINLDSYEAFRLDEADVEIYDEASGYTIILYSSKKAHANKLAINNTQPKVEEQ